MLEVQADAAAERKDSPEQRAASLAQEALADNDRAFLPSLEQWRELIETDAALILAVIGKTAWEYAAMTFMRKVDNHAHSMRMNEVQHQTKGFLRPVRDSVGRQPRKAAMPALSVVKAVEVELGILGSVTIGDKQLAFCTKAEQVNALRPWRRRRTFGSINRSLHRLEALGLLVDKGIPSGPPYPRPHERIASAPNPVVYEPRDRT